MHNPRNGKTLQRLLGAILILAIGKVAIYFLFQGGHDLSAKRREYLASAIVQQGENLRIAAQAMMANGAEIASITFDGNAATGIFNPALGLARPERPPADAFADPAATHRWIKKDNVRLETDHGTATEHVAVVAGLRKDVCGAVNRLLRQNNDASIPRATPPLLAWHTRGTPLDLHADTRHATRSAPDECIETSDGHFVYFAVLVSG